MLSRRSSRVAARPSRRRAALQFEPLEGRRLLAVGQMATTIDADGNTIFFMNQAETGVEVNFSRPTNNATTPYQLSGNQTIPGLTAATIAAFTDADGNPAVVATRGPQSYLYVNRYESTGDLANPRAWTGWELLDGSFVATSVVAASNGGSGAAVFAIGADSRLYGNAYVPTGSAGASAWTGFQRVGDLAVNSVSVTPEAAGSYSIAALQGPESFVHTTRATIGGGTITADGWAQLGDFVARSVTLTPGLNQNVAGESLGDRLGLVAIGGDSQVYADVLTVDPTTGYRVTSGFDLVGDPLQFAAPVIATTAVVSGNYMTVFAINSAGRAYRNQVVIEGTGDTSTVVPLGWAATNTEEFGSETFFMGSSITASQRPGGGGDFIAQDESGGFRINQTDLLDVNAANFTAVLTADFGRGWEAAAGLSNHPIAVAIGPNGLAAVFALGSDGTVNVDRFTSQRIELGVGTFDLYSGIAYLPGIKATSIVATAAPNGIALFALTGEQSFIYVNEYRFSGDSPNGYDWTGWRQTGDFVASAFGAVTVGDTAAGASPTLFALGADRQLYQSQSTALATGSTGLTMGPMTPLTGLGVASFSVRAVGTDILVAALTGRQSYGFANLITPVAGATVPTVPGGWTQTGTYVLSQVLASVAPTGAPIVAGISPLDWQAVAQSLDMNTAPIQVDLNYRALNFNGATYVGYGRAVGLTSVLAPGGAGVTYLNLFTGNRNDRRGIYFAYKLPDAVGLLPASLQPVGSFDTDETNIRSYGVTPEGTLPRLYIVTGDKKLYYSQGSANGVFPQEPFQYTTFVYLGQIT